MQLCILPILQLLHVQHAAPVVVPPADLPTVDLVPGDGLRLGHALVIADQKLKYAANDVRKVPNLKRYAAKSSL